jgi:pimeloyl-ACP methyl ester carboxylesterase
MALRVSKMLVGIVTFIALIILIAWVHDARLRARLLADTPPAGAYIDTPKARLHYLARQHSDKDKPVFVLIHGSSANAHDMMLALGDVLAPHGTVLAFDRPGIGRSVNKISNMEMSDPRKQAGEIHTAVKAMGYDNIIVIGQSWGGSVALGYAQEFGEEINGTVMLAPPIIPWYGPPFWAYRLVTTPIIGPIFAHSILGKYGETQLHAGAKGAATPEVSPENYVFDAALALILQPRAFITNAVYAIELKHHLADMQKRYRDMPGTLRKLLIIHGDKDRTVNIEYNAESFRLLRDDVELIELKGAGHLLHHTWQNEIADAVLRLVKDGQVRPGRHILEKTAG